MRVQASLGEVPAGGLQAKCEPQGGSRRSTSRRGAPDEVRAAGGLQAKYEPQGVHSEVRQQGAFPEVLAVRGSKLPRSHS